MTLLKVGSLSATNKPQLLNDENHFRLATEKDLHLKDKYRQQPKMGTNRFQFMRLLNLVSGVIASYAAPTPIAVERNNTVKKAGHASCISWLRTLD